MDPVGGIREGWKVGEVHGAFEIISSLSEAKRTQAAATVNIVVFTGVLMLILGVGLIFLIRLVLRPLAAYVRAFQQASTGDLTVRAAAGRRDEVGRVGTFFNDFIGTLESMVHEVKNVTEGTNEVSQELAASSEQTAASLHEIRANTEGMKDKIVRLDTEVSTQRPFGERVKDFISRLASSSRIKPRPSTNRARASRR